jgi:Family of unknown function (DUF5652)
MGNALHYGIGMGAPAWIPAFGVGLLVLVLWSIFWKGLALWHSAQRKQIWWFVILLVVNTAGILEIIYLFGVAKLKFSSLFSNSTE